MTENEPFNDSQWQACPPGTLGQGARQLRVRQRRQFLVKSGGAVAACLLGVGIGKVVTNVAFNDSPPPGGLSCEIVRSHLKHYLDRSLEAPLAAQMGQHLEKCPDCDRLMRQMSTGQLS